MLLTITTTHQPATDLGYLLHKHPEKCQSFSLSFGKAHVFYPESSEVKCTVALLLDINPIELVRGKSASDNREGTLTHYVNDRPYSASSFMSVAISNVFRTALSARCKDRPELVEQAIPITVKLPVLPCRGGESFLRQLFEPLGYQVEGETLPLDETFPEWQNSSYISATLHNTVRLCDLLSHLYVLIPVLDDDKHYWVGEEEIAKLLRHGEGWLNNHPVKEQITSRYLKRRRKLAKIALAQLAEEDNPDIEETDAIQAEEEAAIEKPISLNQQRLETVTETLKEYQVKRVIDLGCGEGKLLCYLLKNKSLEQITGVDVAYRTLEIAKSRLKLDNLPFHQQDKIQLIQGSLIYRDKRFQGYDAATVIEVIEHLDLNRLAALERVLFEFAQPKLVIVTTPNIEYNVRFASLASGKLRHRDHRFEWTRKEFQDWGNQVAERFNYEVVFKGIGDVDDEVGTPTQMAIFTV
ncbi:Methyltransferase type 12 [Hyella patelloides LEGE 07179]|uniref:Small RNA 2'-O-methyltransferase n=1 Tax=Hyella patelloides LEGE 07179 TaxID=945734 RepID=A0A563VQ38_9CYAN|nr:3' terminal RNA ribose 2'-O-methyltransferase Hen1 [Hyella patelloides]VEP13582.1 Methyltransferase type 12 [Hyella patelloides LEGE 07179]